MVTHWQVEPVGLESVICSTEHYTDIVGMVFGRVEICVISDFGWKVEESLEKFKKTINIIRKK